MREQNQPKVSIIMGIYNCEETLSESIESIINQSYKNWELIMCDDCSKDRTFEIASKYADLYKNQIKLIRNDRNLTLGPTLNKCIKLVEGKYIARQDGDDLSDINRIEKQVNFIENNPEYDLVGTGMTSFDNFGTYARRLTKVVPKKQELMRGTTFSHATILMKANVMKVLNGYSEEDYAKRVEDYDLWFRFFEKGYKGYNLQEYLYYVREDRDAYKRKNLKNRINEVNIMIRGIKRLNLSKSYYVMLLKPIIAAIVPNNMLMKYHKAKFKVRDN